jgi:hypothetical protein
MEALIRLFANICLFKQGPQDVPVSPLLFYLLLSSNLVVEIFLGLTVYDFLHSFLFSATSVIFLLVFTWLLLKAFQLNSRVLQTTTALIGVNLLTNIFLFIPITLLWKMDFFVDNVFAFINLFLLGWILSIYAHIYKNALNVSFILGLALSITFFIIYSTLSTTLLGVQN